MLDFPQDAHAGGAPHPEPPYPEPSHPEPALSVVVPVHDEEGNVLPLVDELRAALDGVVHYELVFVDDGSSDATAERLAAAASARSPGADGVVRVLRHRTACGQSTAVHTGVLNARGRWVATLDGDGQNDPADIPALLARLTAPDRPARLGMVAGWRTVRRDSWFVRLSSRVANRVRGGLLGDRTPDTGCGLKLFERDLFLRLPYFDHMHRFLPALARRAGAEVESVPVHHRPRVHGRSHYGLHNRLWTGIVDLAGVIWLTRRARLPELLPEALPGRSYPAAVPAVAGGATAAAEAASAASVMAGSSASAAPSAAAGGGPTGSAPEGDRKVGAAGAAILADRHFQRGR